MIDLDADPKDTLLQVVEWLPDRLEHYARLTWEKARRSTPCAQNFIDAQNDALRYGKFLEAVIGKTVPWSNTVDWVAWQVGGTVKAKYIVSAVRDGVRAIEEVLKNYRLLLALEGQVTLNVDYDPWPDRMGVRGMSFNLELEVIDTIGGYEKREKAREEAHRIRKEHKDDETAWATAKLLLVASHYSGRRV